MSVAWVGVGVSALSAYSNYKSAGDARDAQTDAVNSSNALLERQNEQAREDNKPYRETGYTALSRMSDLLGLSGNKTADGYGSLSKPFTSESVATDPGYQFGLKEGLDAAENSASVRGGLYSGATLKALTKYGNDYATTKFDDAFNRDLTTKNSEYNKLAGVAGTGQVATNQVTAAGQNYAGTAGANLIGAGNARGAADIAQGNAISSGLNQGAAWWLRNGGTPAGRSSFRYDDPYRNPGYYGGDEGE